MSLEDLAQNPLPQIPDTVGHIRSIRMLSVKRRQKKFQMWLHDGQVQLKNARVLGAVSGTSKLAFLNILRVQRQKGCAVRFTVYFAITKRLVKRP